MLHAEKRTRNAFSFYFVLFYFQKMNILIFTVALRSMKQE